VFARPLFDGLKARARPGVFELVESPDSGTASLAIQLRQAQLHGAFLSAIDYAKDYSSWSILPGVGVVSEGESRAALLLFKERARKIATIAVDPGSSSEIVLAHLVLTEKFDIVPKIVPFSGPADQALEKADAVLCSGNAAYEARHRKNTIDLVDEWKDITELPFVHGFWVTREDALTPSEVTDLVQGSREGIMKLDGSRYDLDYLGRFLHDLTDQALSALGEFYRMAFYHGILKDIPEVKLHQPVSDPPSPGPSLN
jgi:predicted solute-binding protein